jgi:hypothetical protein
LVDPKKAAEHNLWVRLLKIVLKKTSPKPTPSTFSLLPANLPFLYRLPWHKIFVRHNKRIMDGLVFVAG